MLKYRLLDCQPASVCNLLRRWRLHRAFRTRRRPGTRLKSGRSIKVSQGRKKGATSRALSAGPKLFFSSQDDLFRGRRDAFSSRVLFRFKSRAFGTAPLAGARLLKRDREHGASLPPPSGLECAQRQSGRTRDFY